jgi:Druantia protein DruA
MFSQVDVERIESPNQRKLFQELVSRYHYLGYAMPYGARLQYLAYVSPPSGDREVVGCIQFSSPAWRMKVRDQWIGWDDATRKVGLQHVVNNSRFLVLAKIHNLASTVLSNVLRRLRTDWQNHYGVDPWLVETLVDGRFHGGCYRASNFITLGQTSGRGRMDRGHQRHGAEVKTVMVYPLVKDAAKRLRNGSGG